MSAAKFRHNAVATNISTFGTSRTSGPDRRGTVGPYKGGYFHSCVCVRLDTRLKTSIRSQPVILFPRIPSLCGTVKLQHARVLLTQTHLFTLPRGVATATRRLFRVS